MRPPGQETLHLTSLCFSKAILIWVGTLAAVISQKQEVPQFRAHLHSNGLDLGLYLIFKSRLFCLRLPHSYDPSESVLILPIHPISLSLGSAACPPTSDGHALFCPLYFVNTSYNRYTDSSEIFVSKRWLKFPAFIFLCDLEIPLRPSMPSSVRWGN